MCNMAQLLLDPVNKHQYPLMLQKNWATYYPLLSRRKIWLTKQIWSKYLLFVEFIDPNPGWIFLIQNVWVRNVLSFRDISFLILDFEILCRLQQWSSPGVKIQNSLKSKVLFEMNYIQTLKCLNSVNEKHSRLWTFGLGRLINAIL